MTIRSAFLSLLALAFATGTLAAPTTPAPHSAIHSFQPLDAAPAANHGLPISLVWQDGGRAFYSSAVNAINAQARVGDQEWLATRLGVKCVDHIQREVRHYTRLDGLPGDQILGVAASSRDSVFCVALCGSGDKSFRAVCRFDPISRRWITERTLPCPTFAEYNQIISPLQQPDASRRNFAVPSLSGALLAAGPRTVCFAPSTVLSASDPVLLLRNMSSSQWQSVPLGPTFWAGSAFLQVTFLQVADNDSIWVGTNQGLWRYDPRKEQWRRFLPGQFLFRGTVHGDDVWLVGQDVTQAGVPPPLRLIRVRAGTGESQSWPLPPSEALNTSQRLPLANLVLERDGRVWIGQGSSALEKGSRFCVFNPMDEHWQIILTDDQNGLAQIPDAALPLPADIYGSLNPIYEQRFPHWFCPEAPEAPEPPELPGQMAGSASLTMETVEGYASLTGDPDSRNPTQLHDPGGVTWSLAENEHDEYAIARTEQGRPGREVFPWGGMAVQTTFAVNTLGWLGHSLLLTTEMQTWEFEPKTQAWSKTALPHNGPGGSVFRVIPQGRYCWIGNGQYLVRYDSQTRQTQMRFQSKGSYTLLAVTGPGRLWLVDENHDRLPWKQLNRVEPGTSKPVVVPLTLPAALQPPQEYSRYYDNDVLKVTPLPVTPDPVAVSKTPSGEIVWCIGWMRIQEKKVVCLIGYRPATRQWTAPQPAGWNEIGDPHPITVGNEVYIPAAGDAGAIWKYDMVTGQWDRAAGRLKDGLGFGAANELAMISVDADALWCLDDDILRVCRFDRKAKTWAIYPCPSRFGGDARTDKAVRVGSAIFVASRGGLWRFDIQERQWHLLSAPDYEREIRLISGDKAAIWGKYDSGVARFDKTTHQWKTFPGPRSFNEIEADDESVWLYGNSPAFRLDQETGRWRNLSEGALPSKQGSLYIRDVVADGAQVWLLPGEIRVGRNEDEGSSQPIPVLGRYDKKTQTITWMNPTTPVRTCLRMLVQKNAVWIATQNGVYEYDKAPQTLSLFRPPDADPVPSDFAPNEVAQDGDALWFTGFGCRLRWTP